jgi:dephospho-CoA kinase
MSRKLVVAIGSINSGKDFIMNRLQSRLIYRHRYTMSTTRTRFADSLNEAVAPILGISVKELQDRSLKEQPRFIFDNPKKTEAHIWSSRDVQKRVGQLLRENLGEDVFINALDRKYSNPSSILLISDLRYQNELEWVRKQGGKVVYIHNEAAAQTQKARESIPDDKHYPPESELLQWDFYNRAETPDYWLDNNDFDNHSHFDDFVEFVLDYLEK